MKSSLTKNQEASGEVLKATPIDLNPNKIQAEFISQTLKDKDKA